MTSNVRKSVCALALAAGTLMFGAAAANAEVTLDLATSSPQNAGNGGLFYQTDLQPTGTGVLQPFVRIQAKPIEEGYNTDGVIEFNTKDQPGNWTHSITLSQVPIVTIDGVQYREFVLDINESTAQNNRFLSMNEMQVYLSNVPNLSLMDRTAMTFASPAGNVTNLVYDLDSGADKLVRMDYSLASGSGSGDMFAYIRNDLFVGSGPYVYLYSKFGNPDGSDAGFEEWATRPGTAPAVPLPASIWGGLALLGLMGAAKIRSRRQSA
ncbi:MAG TPA: hypothetical protein VGP99_12105 [Tepidisphaeraceae bacterium]|jgi:hypothetical protein|nr:hypothetical protein [Tepidisphaeraceae bacterium]